MVSDTEVQLKNEQFSLLVKRARRQALLKSMLISVGTSIVFHCLIGRKLFRRRESEKGWK